MLKVVDDFLNSTTMYRLVLYVLIALVVLAVALSFAKLLPFDPAALFFSAVFLTAACWVTNTVFAKIFKAQTNLESVYITGLILALIITPFRTYQDLIFLGLAAFLSQMGKYILVVNKKHIFNPAVFAVAITAITLNHGASWWVGTSWMMPFTAIGGVLILRKIKRFDMMFAFFTVALAAILGNSALKGDDLILITQKIILDTPILFFAFVMLVEPLTAPPTKKWQIVNGGLVGLLFSPIVHIGSFYFTPEAALLLGNIFSYVVSPKERLLLKLKEKIQIAPDIYDFIFGLNKRISYAPGQYMEWTLGYKNPDSRGNRRYFTIAASPLEGDLRIGVKFYPEGSSFKRSLLQIQKGDQIVASQLAGEFTLPKDPGKKLCFIAGGIGITPFRSMIKYLLDTSKKMDITLLYSNKTARDIAYKEIFDEAFQKLGIKTVYVNTDTMGYIDAAMIKTEVPDFEGRTFYISGPHSMVDVFKEILKEMGISRKQIKVDFFPGYA